MDTHLLQADRNIGQGVHEVDEGHVRALRSLVIIPTPCQNQVNCDEKGVTHFPMSPYIILLRTEIHRMLGMMPYTNDLRASAQASTVPKQPVERRHTTSSLSPPPAVHIDFLTASTGGQFLLNKINEKTDRWNTFVGTAASLRNSRGSSSSSNDDSDLPTRTYKKSQAGLWSQDD